MDVAAPRRYTGRVKWWNSAKGFGFITADVVVDGIKDLFVHYKDVKTPGFPTLHEGQRVSYRMKRTPKGARAVDVIPIR